MPGPRHTALEAGLAGARAYRAGKPVTVCPFTVHQPLARRAFAVGYAAARRGDGGPDHASIEEQSDPDAPWPGDLEA